MVKHGCCFFILNKTIWQILDFERISVRIDLVKIFFLWTLSWAVKSLWFLHDTIPPNLDNPTEIVFNLKRFLKFCLFFQVWSKIKNNLNLQTCFELLKIAHIILKGNINITK